MSSAFQQAWRHALSKNGTPAFIRLYTPRYSKDILSLFKGKGGRYARTAVFVASTTSTPLQVRNNPVPLRKIGGDGMCQFEIQTQLSPSTYLSYSFLLLPG
jgi:hypothetical protein